MGFYKDKTADFAVGHANKEWKQMARIALKIKQRRCSAKFEDYWTPKFTGVFSRLLKDSEEELDLIIHGKRGTYYEEQD